MAEPMSISLKVKLFADGARLEKMVELAEDPAIKGFTTNPTLMRQSGVTDYRLFCKEILTKIPDKPISFEVFADEFYEMKRQALEISGWGKNVYVKIPITNCEGEKTTALIHELSRSVRVNVTAVLTASQVAKAVQALKGGVPSILSVFAGRIADTGRDPEPILIAAKDLCRSAGASTELLWASTRELFNLIQADRCGCDIITVPHDLLGKLSFLNKDLTEYSRETVRTFKKDADAAGYVL